MNISIKTPVAIIGMGRSGKSAKNLLLAAGIPTNEICTFDFKEGVADFSNPELMFHNFQPKTLVVSPGVPLQFDWIQNAKKSGIQITSEINLATQFLTTEKIVGITGSLGKSTTVSLLDAGLKSFSKDYFVGGNIGTPFCEYALEVLTKKRTTAEWIVLELSSYQLENSSELKLDQSAITYFAANHLERYENKEQYYLTKWNIHQQTRGIVLINAFGGDLLDWYKQHSDSKFLVVSKYDSEFIMHNLDSNQLIGSHNIDNLALATKIAILLQWPEIAITAMKKFKGLRHRLENLGTIHNRNFINDSKATTIESVLSAVQAVCENLNSKKYLHLLIGGKDKGLPWNLLSTLKTNSQIKFYFFGECGSHAKSMSGLSGDIFSNLESATMGAFQQSFPQDFILLSPGGTSLDQFSSFEERGDYFEKLVRSF